MTLHCIGRPMLRLEARLITPVLRADYTLHNGSESPSASARHSRTAAELAPANIASTSEQREKRGERRAAPPHLDTSLSDKSADSRRGERDLDALQRLNLLLFTFFMGAQLSLPYVLAVYLVRDFYAEAGASEQLIGQLTGLLAAAQSFSRSLTAYPWGILSDKLGRKVCVLIGIIASSASIVGFGLSRSFTAAILTRALPALLVGSGVALKAMIGEMCDQTGQAKAIAIFNLGHGLGTILGPAMGGPLSYPCKKFRGMPFCAEGSLFHGRPFLLPCLAVALLGILATLACALFMEESHPEITKLPGGWQGNLLRLLCCRGSCVGSSDEHEKSLLLDGPLRSDVDVEAGKRHGLQLEPREQSFARRDPESRPAHRRGDSGVEVEVELVQHDSREKMGGEGVVEIDVEEVESEAGSHEGRSETARLKPGKDADDASSAEEADYAYRWWRDRNVCLALVASGLVAFLFNFQDELAPIYVSAPQEQGGLSMPLEVFTWPITFGGLTLVVFSLAAYPRLTKRFGSVVLCRAGLVCGVPAAILLPLASLLTRTYPLELVSVFASSACHSVAKICALNSCMIVTNLVAPKAALGAVNGAAMTLQSGGRALGPLLSGSTWALVVTLRVAGQQFVGFALVIGGYLATQFLYLGVHIPRDAH